MARFLKTYNKDDVHKPKDPSRLTLVDLEAYRITQQEDGILFGHCIRCGACCFGERVPYPGKGSRCKHLAVESTNPDGSSRFKCEIYEIRPVTCAMWPEPSHQTPPSCSFYWIRGESNAE